MKKILTTFFIALLYLIFIPYDVLAADFEIKQTNIDAYLQPDGNVFVEESHTYEFDGDFNGITRSLIPKKETEIINFHAEEMDQPLEVEQDDELYSVYRSGEDEQITVDLTYKIIHAVEVYEDMAQFYWPFFDSSNESDYENLTITIHPPQPTSANETIAFGYDTAFDTETVQSNGIVEFSLGTVKSDKNGDIRVAYEQALFPLATSQSNTIRETLIEEKAESEEKHLAFFDRQDKLNDTALPIIIGFSIFFIFLLFYAWRRKQLVKLEVQRQTTSVATVPESPLSMPATVYYYNNLIMDTGELLTVGMMELVRKGYITEEENGNYYLRKTKTDYPHEAKLIELLFEEIGENRNFTFDKLENYTENLEKQNNFQSYIHEYQKLLHEEIEAQQLFDKHLKLRWTTGLISLTLIPYMIILGYHDLFMWVFFALMSMFALLGFALFYKSINAEGIIIKEQWQSFKTTYEEMEPKKWMQISQEEQERALVFSAGLKDENVTAKNKLFTEHLTRNHSDIHSTALILMLMTISTSGHRSFETSSQSIVHASGGGYSGGGTGVGGGGGGSGAF